MSYYTTPNPVFLEIQRDFQEVRNTGSTFCNCCGTVIVARNTKPDNVYQNYGYVCWLSDTQVEEGVFTEYFIEVLPLEDGTFLVIKGNIVEDDNDD